MTTTMMATPMDLPLACPGRVDPPLAGLGEGRGAGGDEEERRRLTSSLSRRRTDDDGDDGAACGKPGQRKRGSDARRRPQRCRRQLLGRPADGGGEPSARGEAGGGG
uniref:DUF834 domain-containing protein n=1 Tax=Oryza rufipogon TaxID=4529 RepID=A0A0E0P7D2_ORYRU